ncbi:uncharacterized protein LOC124420001 [Lucilia cuprina]|uniref:uncharacterized protein LOC124420001 n=1 Tax=Lucilia cuprina TaxID=7375 RepID=UPI001F066A26|nr:uncharacterized protein LOC124420001 [Lucilia cuprina]
MSSGSKYSILIFLILTAELCNGSKQQKGPRLVYFVKSDLTFNPRYLQDHFIIIAPDRLTVNITLNFAVDFINDPWAEIMLGVKNRKDNNYRNLFKYDINVCTVLGKSGVNQLNKFALGWINNVWKYGNLPKSCPLKKDNYSFINLRPEKINIPNFIPLGRYRAVVYTYFREGVSKDYIANCTVYVDIK